MTMVKVKFEFLDSLKNECYTFSTSSFFENREWYIDKVVCLETGVQLSVPPYCAEKSFMKYLQSLYPQGRITVLYKKDVS